MRKVHRRECRRQFLKSLVGVVGLSIPFHYVHAAEDEQDELTTKLESLSDLVHRDTENSFAFWPKRDDSKARMEWQ